MRQEAIGLALAALLIGGLFFAVGHRAERTPAAGTARTAIDVPAINAAAAAIKPGFVGLKRVGAWEIACAATPVVVDAKGPSAVETAGAGKSPPLPLSLGENKPIASTAHAPPATGAQAGPAPVAVPRQAKEKVSLGRCRATQAFRRKNAPKDKVVLAVNFRIVGAAPGRLGLFVRMPKGKGRQGENLQLRLAKGGFNLPIASCGTGGCMAVAIFGGDAERDLSAAKRGELLMAPNPGGKRTAIRLTFVGLPEALAAIRRAQG